MDLPQLLYISQTALIGLLMVSGLILVYTFFSSSIIFHLQVRRQPTAAKDTAATPPLLPYVVPGLGSTVAFSSKKVGSFFEYLRAQSQRYGGLGALSIILGGQRTNFIFSVKGISAMWTSKALVRDELDAQIARNVLGMSRRDAKLAFLQPHRPIHAEHLLSTSAVNQLTSKFLEFFTAALKADSALDGDGVEVKLYAWLWSKFFRSSTPAVFGTKLLEMYPDLHVDYCVWEENLLGLLFGVPRLFAPKAYAALEACLSKLENWQREAHAHRTKDSDLEWDPCTGSRLMRKRDEYITSQNMSPRAHAGFALILLGGVTSNATPAAGWMLLHLLSPISPHDFLPNIMEELRSSQKEDGSVDISSLMKQPLLNSAFYETLRLYVDFLLVRQVDTSTTLGPHKVRKGDIVMAPTWMVHRSPEHYERPLDFVPDRFIVQDPETGKPTCSLSGLNAKYFPFGGGHYMCPGRTFAKQEVLAAIAVLLLNYDVEFRGFVDGKGEEIRKSTPASFPKMAPNFPGNQVVGIDGDMKVKIRRRR